MIYVDVADMEKRVKRTFSTRSIEAAQRRLMYLEAAIRGAFPDLEDRIDSGKIDLDTLREIVLTCATSDGDPWLSDEQWSQLGGTVRRIVYDRSGYGCVV